MPIILIVRPRPISLYYRPLLDSTGGVTLVEWCVAHIRSETVVSIYAIVSEEEEEIYHDPLRRAGARLIRDPFDDELAALQRACQAGSLSSVIVVYPEVTLAPQGLLTQVEDAGRHGHWDWLTVDGLPPEVAPLYTRATAIDVAVALGETLKELVGRHPARHLRASLEFATRVSNNLTDDGKPLRRGHVPFDAASQGLQASPASVTFAGPQDVAAAKRVAMSDPPHLKSWMALRPTRFPAVPAVAPKGKASRVLFVSNASMVTGGQQALNGIVRHLDASRFDAVALVAHEGAVTERLRQVGCTVICPNRGFAENERFSLDYVLDVLRAVGPSVVHINDFSGMAIMHVSVALRVPTVFHVRVPGAHLLREPLASADHVIAVSEHVRREIRQNDVPDDKITTVHSGIDIETMHHDDVEARVEGRTQWGLDLNAELVLMVARFHPIKRHDVLLHAMSIVARHRPSARCVLVGESDPADSTRAKVSDSIESLGLSEVVRIVGFKAEMRKMYAAADVFVLCSEREPLGISALEAMAHCVPVILSSEGELVDLVTGVEWARCVPRGDPAMLAGAIETVLRDLPRARRMARAGRAFVAERFGARAMCRSIESVYERLLSVGCQHR